MFKTRLLSGIVLVIIALQLVYIGGGLLFATLDHQSDRIVRAL